MMQTLIANVIPISIGLLILHLMLSVALHGIEFDAGTFFIGVLCFGWAMLSFTPGLNVVMAMIAAVILILRLIGLLHNKLKYRRWTF